MNLQELQNLDPQNIGGWPAPIRFLVVIVVCAAVLGAGYYFDTQNQIVVLEQVASKESELRSSFEVKQRKAANLKPLKEQMKLIEQSFGELLRLLPNKTEIEGLLVEISQAGLAAGLEFDLFKPADEQPQEFFAVQPIQIQVQGTYHEFGEFISAVAELPRIVTQHDIAIQPRGGASADEGEGAAVALTMSMIAKTYRYLEEEEIEELQTPKKK